MSNELGGADKRISRKNTEDAPWFPLASYNKNRKGEG